MKLTPEIIKQIVSEEFEVDEFIVPHRKEVQRVPRQVYSYLLWKYANMVPAEICKIVKRHRTNVYNDIKVVRETLVLTPYNDQIKRCEAVIDAGYYEPNKFYWLKRLDLPEEDWQPAMFVGNDEDGYYIFSLVQVIYFSKDEFETDGQITHP